jgi:hypothetical protein
MSWDLVRYGSVTAPTSPQPAERRCPVCGTLPGSSRATYCSDAHRQLAYRQRQSAPSPPPARLPRRHLVVYQCPRCEERYLGEQRCEECNVFCRKLGAGGPCPHCEEPVAVSDLFVS